MYLVLSSVWYILFLDSGLVVDAPLECLKAAGPGGGEAQSLFDG